MHEYANLPDAEFDVMQIVWGQPSPISSVQIYGFSVAEKKWKPQTVLTLLTRLEKRGFLSSEKKGKERYYTPLITRDDYLNRETGLFVKRFHKNSLTGLMSALFGGRNPKEEDLNEIEGWLRERQKEKGWSENDV
jgi:predicted transcriptional regulator